MPKPRTPAPDISPAIARMRAGATVLAMSLAEDLVTCRELRASLWPAEAIASEEGAGA
jgi:hypothetical protein